MTDTPSRMMVSAAIEDLISGSEDPEHAARIVIRYGDRMEVAGSLQVEASSIKSKRDPGVSGDSPGHGNVTIENKREKKAAETSFGVYKDRVGQYRLWKGRTGIYFHHFWKADLTTKGPELEGPDLYLLSYDPGSLEPEFLAIMRARVMLNLGFLQIYENYLEPVFGTVDRRRTAFGINVSLIL